jgi:hypothetical protein
MMAYSKWREVARPIGLALIVVAMSGCSLLQTRPKLDEPVGLIAVMPIERDESASQPVAGEERLVVAGAEHVVTSPDAKPTGHDESAGKPVGGEIQGLAPGAERVVTAQVYGVLSSSPEWRFVPDLTVTQALAKADVSGELSLRARWLGRQVGADTVLFGTVSRYVERVGAEYGAKQPAAVAIQLQLISVKTGTVLWKGAFDQAQQTLSSNLFNWWQFWSGGPKWFSAPEFTRVAVEHLLGDLSKRTEH